MSLFFSVFFGLKELYVCHASVLLSFEHDLQIPLLNHMLGTCLVETRHHLVKSGVFLSFLTFISTFLTMSCQQGAGSPREMLAFCPGERNSQQAPGWVVMGMGGPCSKEKLQTQPYCSHGELTFPDEDNRLQAFFRNSFLRSFAAAVYKFNLQFAYWQEMQKHPTPVQLNRTSACGQKHTAERLWVTTGGQGAAGTWSRGDLQAGPGSKRTYPCAASKGPSWWPEPMAPSEVSKDQCLPTSSTDTCIC